jgi:class III poly(R)-hydroxyalkanoic acid synthase PhaE subunit
MKTKEPKKNKSAKEKESPQSPFNNMNEGMQSWMDMWKKFNQNMPGMDAAGMNASFYPSWLKMYDEIYRNSMSLPMGGGDMGDIYQKFVDAANIYTNLFSSWGGIMEKSDKQFGPEHLKSFLNVWMESQKNIFSRMFGLPLPEMPANITDMKEWAEGVKQSLENWQKMYQEDYRPMMDNWRKASEDALEMMKPGVAPAKSKEFYQAWMKGYESTFGKFLKMPMMGPSRNISDKIMKSVDAFIKYCGSTADFYMVMYSPSASAVEELSKKASETLKGEVTPEKYKEFYELLLKTFEDKFYELFRTPAFADIMKSTLDASLNFRHHHFGVMEEILKGTPIITRNEMDEVYQMLYSLKKRIKELEKQLKDKKKE